MEIYLTFNEKTYILKNVEYFSETLEKSELHDPEPCEEGSFITFRRVVNDTILNPIQLWQTFDVLATLVVVTYNSDSKKCNSKKTRGIISFDDVLLCSVKRSAIDITNCKVIETITAQINYSATDYPVVLKTSNWKWTVVQDSIDNILHSNLLSAPLLGGGGGGAVTRTYYVGTFQTQITGGKKYSKTMVSMYAKDMLIKISTAEPLPTNTNNNLALNVNLQTNPTTTYNSNPLSLKGGKLALLNGVVVAGTQDPNLPNVNTNVGFVVTSSNNNGNPIDIPIGTTTSSTAASSSSNPPFTWQLVWDNQKSSNCVIPFKAIGSYNCTIDWGDKSQPTLFVYTPGNPFVKPSHTYPIYNNVLANEEYIVLISGTTMTHWGSDGSFNDYCYWKDMIDTRLVETTLINIDYGFAGSPSHKSSIKSIYKGTWGANVTSAIGMLQHSNLFSDSINDWFPNMTSLTNMDYMFYDSETFNNGEEAINWNNPQLVTAKHAFKGSPFNQNINAWNAPLLRAVDFMFSLSPFNNNNIPWTLNTSKWISASNLFLYNSSSSLDTLASLIPPSNADWSDCFLGTSLQANYTQERKSMFSNWVVSQNVNVKIGNFTNCNLDEQNYITTLFGRGWTISFS